MPNRQNGKSNALLFFDIDEALWRAIRAVSFSVH
jgi:hypothetical protein